VFHHALQDATQHEVRLQSPPFLAEAVKQSQVHLLELGVASRWHGIDSAAVHVLKIAGPRPELWDGLGERVEFNADSALSVWSAVAERILADWI
jgi:hypothetical protein